MSKAHEEGGDLTSSERLASAFLMLGIAETSADDSENVPLTYKAVLQTHKQENGRKSCASSGRLWLRTIRLTSC
jgi:hypothetical protein